MMPEEMRAKAKECEREALIKQRSKVATMYADLGRHWRRWPLKLRHADRSKNSSLGIEIDDL